MVLSTAPRVGDLEGAFGTVQTLGGAFGVSGKLTFESKLSWELGLGGGGLIDNPGDAFGGVCAGCAAAAGVSGFVFAAAFVVASAEVTGFVPAAAFDGICFGCAAAAGVAAFAASESNRLCFAFCKTSLTLSKAVDAEVTAGVGDAAGEALTGVTAGGDFAGEAFTGVTAWLGEATGEAFGGGGAAILPGDFPLTRTVGMAFDSLAALGGELLGSGVVAGLALTRTGSSVVTSVSFFLLVCATIALALAR